MARHLGVPCFAGFQGATIVHRQRNSSHEELIARHFPFFLGFQDITLAQYPDPPILVFFFVFLAFLFSLIFLAFLERFSFFSKDFFRGSAKRETLAFSGVSLVFFKKKQGFVPVLGALGEFQGILGAALGLQKFLSRNTKFHSRNGIPRLEQHQNHNSRSNSRSDSRN